MENKTNSIENFRQYAEDRLKDHIEELKTKYQNEELGSNQVRQQAYTAHQKIYSRELEEKIQALSKEDNEAKQKMENMKDNYVTKLNYKDAADKI